jgi:hypothetical protein
LKYSKIKDEYKKYALSSTNRQHNFTTEKYAISSGNEYKIGNIIGDR